MNLGIIGRHTIAAPLAALTLVAGGGIALAASGGAGPAPQALEHRTVGKPSPKPTAEPTAEPTDESDDNAAPSPSLTGLCKAHRAGGYASSTKNGRVNPAWSALESAAGGADNVDDFCEATLAADAAAKEARKGTDPDESKADKPTKGPKPAKGQGGDNDDADDNDDAGEIENDDAGEIENDDADSDDEGEGGSRGSEHGKR